MSRNRLDQETSPYLLQHKDNPVHWQPWDDRALADAKATGRPILLSVGYAACHWCHVMAHESFEDAETAALMNELCINVKVDREERPDIDAIYQSALGMMGEHGGWPLTMFLTPDGVPFWGGTYFPPSPRFGRPAFKDLLRTVVGTYHEDPARVAQNVSVVRNALDRSSRHPHGVPLSLDLLDQAAGELLRYVDLTHGGLRGTPKFPQPALFEFLWRAYRRNRVPQLGHAVTLTLEHICQGGIYDHLGGGFARYSTDTEWLVPHFEKMLYDNAQMIDLLTTVWQDTRNPLYAHRIEETVAWLEREMMADGGAFAATLDADSDHEEGKFYVWTEEEIDSALGQDSPAFKMAYDVSPGGNWEGKTILNRAHDTAGVPRVGEDPEFEQSLAICRSILLRERESRVRPMRDDKILADWNGLMIHAVARAGAVFTRSDWVTLAERAFGAVCRSMTIAGQGESQGESRLGHSIRLGRLQPWAVLDDYANMAQAALTLCEVTGDTSLLGWAERWVAVADAHYWDGDDGGYFFTADDAPGLITRTKSAVDTAVPAGNSMMARVLGRLYHITGRDDYRERAEVLFQSFSGGLNDHFPGLATLLNAFETLVGARQVVVVGSPPGTVALRQAALLAPVSDLILMPTTGDRPMIDGKATAYVCDTAACSPPITEVAALQDLLARR